MALLVVKTKYGTVSGVPGNDPKTTVFKGIPFAKPPVGALRFRPPKEPEPWEGTLRCDRFRDACPQYERRNSIGILKIKPRNEISGVPQSEDSLYLNVYTPAASADEKLPVLCWIHGGGFSTGCNFHPSYDGEAINRRGCILVSITYRCNVMGFLALPGVAEGNMGLFDQLMALRWIKENISAFGGDPDNVTIFGQSAGGISSKFHLVSPMSRGLFRRAVIHSGGGMNGADPTRSRAELEKLSARCLEILGWTKEDLMTRPAAEICQSMGDTAEELVKSQRELFVFQPCIDGRFLTEIPELSLAAGKMADADVICGSVEGDHWMFSRKVRHLLDGNPDALLAFAYSPSQSLGLNQLRTGGKSIRTYYFDRHVPGDDRGAPHGCELQYLFGTLCRYELPWTEHDLKISYIMTDYWTNFAKTGDPNGEGLPYWPLFADGGASTMRFSDTAVGACDILALPEARRVAEYTLAHPGMLEELEGF